MMMLHTVALGCLLFVGGANAQMGDPSDMPSDMPTVSPSDMPSDMPSTANATTMTDEPLPSDMPSDLPTGGTGSPTSMPATGATGFECSICLPGMILSLPDTIVPLPEDALTIAQGITEAPCVLIDQGVMANPQLVTEEVCQQLRDAFMEPCGCVFPDETLGPRPTSPPDTTPDTTPDGDTSVCTICPEGQSVTLPDAVISLPDDISLAFGIAFATCSLLEGALETAGSTVDDATCDSVKNFYAEPCGCMAVDGAPTDGPPDSGTEAPEDTSMSVRKHVVAAAGAAIVSAVWMM